MTDDWRAAPLPGVLRRSLDLQEDGRGSFHELWRESWTRPQGVGPFMQANLSRSAAGVLRGIHFHLRQTDMWVVLEGRAHVCLIDIRASLATGTAPSPAYREQLGPGEAIVIPEGVAHGFWALEPLTLLYLVTNEYDGTDEHGFAWNDPEAAAVWPHGQPVLSERDRSAPSLAEALAAAQRSGQISSR